MMTDSHIFVPMLIRKQVLTVGQLLEDDSLLQHLAPTWKPIHLKG